MKKVTVRHIFETVEYWKDEYATKDHIEFKYNEGTSCADNILEAIQAYHWDRQKENRGFGEYCLCHAQKSEVLKIEPVDS